MLICLSGCSNVPNTAIGSVPMNPKLGEVPSSDDLESIFLSFPDELAADMPVIGRKRFIADAGQAGDWDNRFDRTHRYIFYYSDDNTGTGATSQLFFKVIRSSLHRFLVFVHVAKPAAGRETPDSRFTYVLAPQGKYWIDVTDQLLPKEVKRDWYFQPSRRTDVIQAGPYSVAKQSNGMERIVVGKRKVDLLLKGNEFIAVPSSSGDYDVEYD